MPTRYTIKQLKEFTDAELITSITRDRRESCTNVYSPLYKRLSELINKIETAEIEITTKKGSLPKNR